MMAVISIGLAFGLLLPPCTALSSCDPLDPPAKCYLPFPNDFFRRATPNGPRVNLTSSLPLDITRKPIDAEAGGWNELDGFSAFNPIVTFLPELDISQVAPYWDIALSLNASSPTLLIEQGADTRLPHWGELDHASDDGLPNRTKYDRMLMLWPDRKLKFNTTYYVALRGLKDIHGQLIPASEAFSALRDNTATTDPDVEERRAEYEVLFAALAKQDFARETLQLAWSFTTVSQSMVQGRMLHMRDDGFARLPETGVEYKIVSVADDAGSWIARQIEVTLSVPQYVNQQLPGATLVIGKDGLPEFQKFAHVPATVLIPPSVAKGEWKPDEVTVLQYGHGLFGSRGEAHNSYLMSQADRYGYVVIASDWIGMAGPDAVVVGLMMATDLSHFRMVPDRSSQGMLRALVLMRLLASPAFIADAAMQPSGQPLLTVDSPKRYNGNSQGGIFGTVYLALSLDVPRGVIGVGGGPYSILLPRSSDFIFPLFDIIKLRYEEALDLIFILPLLQMLWDRADPAGYVGNIVTDGLTPLSKDIVFHHGLGDAQVTLLGTYNLARSTDATVWESNVHEPGDTLFGLPALPDTQAASRAHLVTWDFPGVPPVPRIMQPPSTDTDVHEGPRRQFTGQEMMHQFFQTGRIVNTCQGPCHGTHNFSLSHTT